MTRDSTVIAFVLAGFQCWYRGEQIKVKTERLSLIDSSIKGGLLEMKRLLLGLQVQWKLLVGCKGASKQFGDSLKEENIFIIKD